MTKTQAKNVAANIVAESIGVAYYKISDDNDYSQKEKELIIEYINQLGKRACKAIGKEYITY